MFPNLNMKRRQFFSHAAVGVATTTALAACTNATSPTVQGDALPMVRWNMATSWPTSLDIISSGAETLSKRVSEMTSGRFSIQPYAAGELVPATQVFDAVEAGNVECGHTASYYYIGKSPALAFATSVPFGLNAQQQNAWLYHGGGLEAIQKIYADFGIINFPAGNTGTQMGGWFKREIKTLADLKGLKMRIPGLGGQVMERLGVNVQVIPGGEIFLALERGAIDAAEWAGPYDDEKLGLHNAAQFYYYPGWWEPGATLDVLVNLEKWNQLPIEYQEIFKTAAYEANVNMLAQYEARNGKMLKTLIEGGTKLTPYSKELLEAAQKASFDLFEEKAKKDANFKEVYEQWKVFRDEIYQWNKINALSYDNFVMGGN